MDNVRRSTRIKSHFGLMKCPICLQWYDVKPVLAYKGRNRCYAVCQECGYHHTPPELHESEPDNRGRRKSPGARKFPNPLGRPFFALITVRRHLPLFSIHRIPDARTVQGKRHEPMRPARLTVHQSPRNQSPRERPDPDATRRRSQPARTVQAFGLAHHSVSNALGRMRLRSTAPTNESFIALAVRLQWIAVSIDCNS